MKKQYKYKRSPWGQVDFQHIIAEGIVSVCTPSHGGLKLDARRQAIMPAGMRTDDGWYEEDCEWAKVFVVFRRHILDYCRAHPDDPNTPYTLTSIERAPESLKNWYPEQYERWFGCQIPPGESYVREHPWPAHIQIVSA